jgi:hypothetical protein
VANFTRKTLCEVATQIRLIVPQISRAVGATFATKLIFSDVCLAHLVESGSSYARVDAQFAVLYSIVRADQPKLAARICDRESRTCIRPTT